MKKKFNIGLIGLGHAAKNWHIPAWQRNKFSRLHAIYDTNKKKIDYFKKKIPKILSVKNINEFSKVKIDIINICTTPSSHFQNLKYSLKLNKPILIEKPILTNSNEMKKLKKYFKKFKSYIQCSLHHRHRSISIEIKKLLKKKEIGNIYYINIIHRKFRSIPKQSKIFSNKNKSGGGPLIDLGSHYFDLICWLLNFPKIKKIMCVNKKEIFKNKLNKRYLPFNSFNNEELALGNILFANKVLCNFEIGYCLNTSDEKVAIEIFGSKGSITWPNGNLNILKKDKIHKRKIRTKKFLASDEQINFFIKNIRNKNQNIKNILEYKYIVDLIDKLYKSSSKNE